MYNNYRLTEHVDFNTTVNNLTQSLRDLPTDYAARVKNFLAEYLGSPQHPVPFGGRFRDFEHLDDWLSDPQSSPYLLLAAPAGRGKSALLLRWCQRLLVRRDHAVAYFPVSIRFRTNLAGVTFPALVALLARLHSEKVPADPNLPEEVWRSLLVNYLTRPLPAGRSLVLVLDGVDEAADWTVGPSLFSQNPPPGLHIVLSARYLANDEDANAWLKRLDWTRPGLARTLELYPLDRTGIASVLDQMGFPLDLLSTRVNIVSELYRLSEGDPLLVRLYVDDLWERGEAAVRFQPEDLRAIRPGLAGYFERWWKDQRLLWSEEAPQREAAAQIVLNLLAGALGPLSKEDIMSLAPDASGFKLEDLDQHLASLARFVTGDGVRQGYVFSHPRLGNYFLEERLSATERQEVEQRYLAWGEQTLVALNEGRLTPENASHYIIQYYGAHLERAHPAPHILLGLVSDGWRRAWEKLDRANAGFLGDVERAWQAAQLEDTTTTDQGEQASYLGAEIRCLLSQVSVNSMTSNISPRLMLEAVKTGIWTPAQGLACIRLITDLPPRARELVGMAPYVQEPLRTDILQEALDTVMTIKDEYVRLDALVELSSGLSAELLWQVLEIIPAIDDEADRAGVLAELAPALSPHPALLEKALDFVQEMEDEEYRALALEGLAPCLSTDQHTRVLQLVQEIQDEIYRAETLMALTPYLAENQLQDILRQARIMQDGLSRIRLLTELVSYLAGQLQAETVQEALGLEQDIEDREYRIEVLVKLAPFLPQQKLQQALEEIQLLWDESYRARALSDLIAYIPAELLSEFLQTVLAMKSEEARTKVLLQLSPRLAADLIEQTLDTVQATWDEGRRAELLSQLALYTPEALLPRLLEIIPTIGDQGYRVWLLAELEAPLAGKLPGEYFNMPAVFSAIRERDDRLQTLLAITPRVSQDALSRIFDFMLPEVFNFQWRVRSEEMSAHILAKLGSRLPEDWLPTALDAVRKLKNEVYQAQALVALAPRINETLLPDALAIVRSMKDRAKRTEVLEVLVSSLPEERKGERVQEMLQVLQVIKDEAERRQTSVACVPYLPATLSAAQAQIAVDAIRVMRDERNRALTLKALASHLPEEMFEEVLALVQALSNDEERAQLLEALAPRVPEEFFPRFLSLIQALQVAQWRTQVLTTVVAHAPRHIIAGMLARVQGTQDDYERAEMVRALGTHAPEDIFAQLWEATQAIADEGRRVWVLGALALRMPEGFFPQLWAAIQPIPNEGWQLWVLRTLVPHMSESLFSHLWEAVQAIEDKSKRTRIMSILLPYVPERFFSQIWQAVQAVPNGKAHWQMLAALAPRVPEEFFLQFFNAMDRISLDVVYIQVMKALAPRVPEKFMARYLIAVQALSVEESRVFVLESLLPHIPESSFSQLWAVVQALQDERMRVKILVLLAPHIPAGFFPQVWQFVLATGNILHRTQFLRALLPYLPQEKRTEALEIVQVLLYAEVRIDILEVLVPYLSAEKCSDLLDALLPLSAGDPLDEIFVQPTGEANRVCLRTLAVLLPHLPHQRLQTIMPSLLKAIYMLKMEDEQTWLLTKLASNVPEDLLNEMLDAVAAIDMQQHRVQILDTLLLSLSQTAWAKVLALLISRIRASKDINFALQTLKIADPLIQQSAPALLYPILREILHQLAAHPRRDALNDLALLIPALNTCGGEKAITETFCATLETGCWWP
jgi:uncharacterized protein YeeX (DUF496 family)